MSFTVNALCRGTGKGYISICTDTDPGELRAEAVKDDGTVFPCPIYRFSFPEKILQPADSGEKPPVTANIRSCSSFRCLRELT